MDIVLDTQAINRQHRLDRPPASILLEQAHAAGHVVCVPEVVISEMTSHFRRDVESAAHQVTRNLGRLSELLRRQLASQVDTAVVEREVKEYEQWLREYLVRHDVQILPMPGAARDVTVLLRRDLQQRKPFRDGRGLRDALLWESVLERLGQTTNQLALVTGNTDDFCENGKQGELHADLVQDVANAGIAVDRVRHFGSIADVLTEVVTPVTDRLEAIRLALEDGSYGDFDLNGWVEAKSEDYLYEHALLEDLELSVSFRAADLRSISEIYDIEIYAIAVAGAPDELFISGEASISGVARVKGSVAQLTGRSGPRWEDRDASGEVDFRAQADFQLVFSTLHGLRDVIEFKITRLRSFGRVEDVEID